MAQTINYTENDTKIITGTLSGVDITSYTITMHVKRPLAVAPLIFPCAITDGPAGEFEVSPVAASPLSGAWAWDGITTILSDDTSEVSVGDFIQLNSDEQTDPLFEIASIVANTSVTIRNPNNRTIPTGSDGSTLHGSMVPGDSQEAEIQVIDTTPKTETYTGILFAVRREIA